MAIYPGIITLSVKRLTTSISYNPLRYHNNTIEAHESYFKESAKLILYYEGMLKRLDYEKGYYSSRTSHTLKYLF